MSSGRFAPSPTGALHLGNLRTAMLAWLWSRREGGSFVIRMEDLDRVTSSPAHEATQLADLASIGLDWDGEVVRQSERFDRYNSVIERLAADGQVYECYCTRREIAEASSAPNGPQTAGMYPGTCRDLSDRERDRRRAVRPAAIRLRSDGHDVTIVDEVVGSWSGPVDDVVLRRNDGVPAYNLAVVVDDVAQGVDLIVRADDLLPTVPAQVFLRSLLTGGQARFAHVPLVLSERGQRLAKRDGAVTLADRLTTGDSVSDVVAALLRSIGVACSGDDGAPEELMAHALDAFRPDTLPRSPVVFSDATLASRFDS